MGEYGYSIVIVLLQCCYSVVTILLQCLLQCCYSVCYSVVIELLHLPNRLLYRCLQDPKKRNNKWK
jgi:hypothetical protein